MKRIIILFLLINLSLIITIRLFKKVSDEKQLQVDKLTDKIIQIQKLEDEFYNLLLKYKYNSDSIAHIR